MWDSKIGQNGHIFNLFLNFYHYPIKQNVKDLVFFNPQMHYKKIPKELEYFIFALNLEHYF